MTAAGLPVVLFAVLAGTIGDLVDRRRFLLVTQTLMLVAAAALGALAIAGLVTPWVLLALIFAVGPAIGGLILAATNAGTVFIVNAVTFLAVLGVLAAWHSTRAAGPLPREHIGEAVRAGGRYVAASPALRVVLIRAGLFIFFASAVWALLPVTARSALHLGSGGYGLLLGSVGVGAVAGAAVLPRLRARLSADVMLTTGSIGLAAVTLVLAFAHVTVADAVALVVGGACWILALSTLNSVYQLSLPQWIKARGMSFYLVVFQGGNAIGSAVMGIAAGYAGLSPTLAIAATGLALGPLAALAWRFQPIRPEELQPAGDWPAPQLAADTGTEGHPGPILVTVEYRATPGREHELMTILQDTRFSRRRTGAISWRAWRDASDPRRILEQFVVASWDEHLRQHERVTTRDQARLDRVRASPTRTTRSPSPTGWPRADGLPIVRVSVGWRFWRSGRGSSLSRPRRACFPSRRRGGPDGGG